MQCHEYRRFEPPEPFRPKTSKRPVESEIASPKESPPASRLWGGKANPFDSIQPQAVVQGSLDNCYLLSALASLARTRPELLKEMISENTGGQSFTICFPGAKDRKVTVEAPTERELAKYTKSTEFGIWPAILEKALGKYLKENKAECLKLLGHELANSNSADLAQHTDGGGRAAMMLQLLTGNPTSGVEIHRRRDPEPSHDLLKSAFHTSDRRLPVVAVIAENNADALKAGLTPKHAYSVLAYDPDTRILTLRDPYGKAMQNSEGLAIETNNGVFRMRLDHFIHLFDELSCGGSESSGTRGFMIIPKHFRTDKQVK